MKDQHFLDIWDAYNQCIYGSDFQQMQANLQVLDSAPKPISLDDSPIPVPLFLKTLTSDRGSRLAVDPRAMAASCSIHLAEVAQQSADSYTALQTFQSIIKNYPEPQYAFYVSKANQAIEHLSSVGLHIPLPPTTPWFVKVELVILLSISFLTIPALHVGRMTISARRALTGSPTTQTPYGDR